MRTAVTTALVLGLSAGLSPGPLFMLVIAQSVRHGTREGVKTALAPLLTDGPFITLVLASMTVLSKLGSLLAFIGFAGTLYLLYLAWETWTSRPPDVLHPGDQAPRSLLRGVVVNLLNPNPWIFWFTVGPSTLGRAWSVGNAAVAAFIIVFLSCLVGSKIALAILAGRSRGHLGGRWYVPTMRVLALTLVAMAMLTARDAWRMLG